MGNRKKKRNTGLKSKSNAKSPSPSNRPAIQEDSFEASTEANARPQMHHYVPRWILRKFSDQQGGSNAPPKGLETIYCYSVETGDLIRRPVSEAYAVADLYKDSRNPLDSYGIEKKLGELEGHASRVFTNILKSSKKKSASGSVICRLNREDLNNIRKFMFIMHYHQQSIAETYFQEDHPENANISSWIKAFRKRNNLSPSDVWLHVLRYYLFTSHSDIIKHGTEAGVSIARDAQKAGLLSIGNPNMMDDLSKMEINPDLEHWESIAYSTQMGGLFLNIWEAAPGEEFVISSNSFGLYEGQKANSGSLHRFYVVSPKIVLVLCDVSLKPGPPHPFRLPIGPDNLSLSMIMDAPHIAAKVDYLKKGNLSDRDVFELEISTLSAEQTHTINAIALAHVNDSGTVTFNSEDAVLRTLDAFARNRWFPESYKSRYTPLIRTLRGKLGKPALPLPGPQENLGVMLLLRASQVAAQGKLWETHCEIYRMLHVGNDDICEIYKEFENAIIGATVDVFTNFQLSASTRTRVNATASDRPARLVRRMDDALASELFSIIGPLFITGEPDLDKLNMFPEQVTIGVLDWLLKHDRGLFVVTGEDQTIYEPSLSKIKEYIAATKSISLGPTGKVAGPVPQSTVSRSTSEGTIATPPEEVPQDFLESIFLRYQNSRAPAPGTFYETNLEIYRLLHGQNYKTDNYFRPHKEKAIKVMTARLQRLGYPGSPNSDTRNIRPVQLIKKLEDHHAFLLFGYMSTQLGEGGIILSFGPVFKEQIVIGVLDWLLKNWRAAFEEIERTVLARATQIQRSRGLPRLRGAPSENPNRYLRLSEDLDLEEVEDSPRQLEEPEEFSHVQRAEPAEKSGISDMRSDQVITEETAEGVKDVTSTQDSDLEEPASSEPNITQVKDEGKGSETTKQVSRTTMLKNMTLILGVIMVLLYYLGSN